MRKCSTINADVNQWICNKKKSGVMDGLPKEVCPVACQLWPDCFEYSNKKFYYSKKGMDKTCAALARHKENVNSTIVLNEICQEEKIFGKKPPAKETCRVTCERCS